MIDLHLSDCGRGDTVCPLNIHGCKFDRFDFIRLQSYMNIEYSYTDTRIAKIHIFSIKN